MEVKVKSSNLNIFSPECIFAHQATMELHMRLGQGMIGGSDPNIWVNENKWDLKKNTIKVCVICY